MRQINAAGLALIEQCECLRLEAYFCPAGRLTIGYGHTGSDVVPGMTVTEAQANALLVADVQAAGAAVLHAVTVPLTENQFAALVDFTFNLGAGALLSSTMLSVLNSGQYEVAAKELLRWVKAHVDGETVTLPGLMIRRVAEHDLFLSPDPEDS